MKTVEMKDVLREEYERLEADYRKIKKVVDVINNKIPVAALEDETIKERGDADVRAVYCVYVALKKKGVTDIKDPRIFLIEFEDPFPKSVERMRELFPDIMNEVMPLKKE